MTAVAIWHKIVKREVDNCDDEGIKIKVQAILEPEQLLAETEQAEELAGLIKFIRPSLTCDSKVKLSSLLEP